MGKASRDKGKRGERECVAFFQALGGEARREWQAARGHHRPDVSVELGGEHLVVEVKRYRERLDWRGALAQAQEAVRGSEIPLVYARRDREEAVVFMPAAALIRLLQASVHVDAD